LTSLQDEHDSSSCIVRVDQDLHGDTQVTNNVETISLVRIRMQDLFATYLLTYYLFAKMPMLPMSTVGPGMLAGPAGAQNSSGQAAQRSGAGRAARGLSIFSWKQSSINPGSTLTTTHPGGWLSWILDLCESQSIYRSIYLSCVSSVKPSDHSLFFVSSCSFCWPCLLPRQGCCV
jgi:hypothetical protein